MKTKVTALVLMVAALVVASCSSPAIRIKHNPELFASIPAPEQELIKQGRIGIGFTPDMVKLALGEPDVVARRIDRTGTSETWRYRGYDSTYNVSFHGYYGWGGPYRYRSWGGWGGWPGYYGWGWSAPAPVTDYLRVTIRDGRVIEINQLR
jgi:hypothetical protein